MNLIFAAVNAICLIYNIETAADIWLIALNAFASGVCLSIWVTQLVEGRA
jgi:hypothetical protein